MPEEEELFVEKNVEVEIKEPEPEDTGPAIESTPLTPEPEPEPEPEKVIEKPKKTRKKRVLTEAQKEQLKINLAKGRATSLANRQKKKKLKDIAKEEQTIEEDTKIFENLKKKLTGKQLAEENQKLKAELAELKAAKAKPERPPTPTPESAENKKVEPQPMPTIPEKKKPLTSRQKMKLLRGL